MHEVDRHVRREWFSTFLLKALVRRVKRRMPIRIDRFCPLGIAGADVLLVRIAGHTCDCRADALAGGVAPLRAFRRGAVVLHQHGVIMSSPKGAFNGVQIGLVAVSGELHAIGQPIDRSPMNTLSGIGVAAAH